MEFFGMGDGTTKIITKVLHYFTTIIDFFILNLLKGLGKFIEISFEFMIKLIHQIYRFIRR